MDFSTNHNGAAGAGSPIAFTLEQKKARAYDLMAQIEYLQQQLAAVNRDIVQDTVAREQRQQQEAQRMHLVPPAAPASEPPAEQQPQLASAARGKGGKKE